MDNRTDKYERLLYNSLLMVLVFSCQKNIKDDYPEEAGCEQYAGLYDMYDPDNDKHYNTEISCHSGLIFTSTKWDSVKYTNFADLFSLGHGVGNGSLNGTIIQPLTDKNGHRWTFANSIYPDTINRINVQIGDSIYLWFNINNTAYWIDDGVPYRSTTSVHSGAKIH